MAQELEAKFYVRNLAKVRQQLDSLGAQLTKQRVLEQNLRFDTDDGKLSRSGQVLRLRQDKVARLTYKDSGQLHQGALNRREIEFTVSDFTAARQFLEALGYRLIFVYEKQRTTYALDQLEIMLDEMPYGDFVEIEGQSSPLQTVARKLGLRWDASVPRSYSQLFDDLRSTRTLGFRDLTFKNFSGVHVSPSELGVQPADA